MGGSRTIVEGHIDIRGPLYKLLKNPSYHDGVWVLPFDDNDGHLARFSPDIQNDRRLIYLELFLLPCVKFVRKTRFEVKEEIQGLVLGLQKSDRNRAGEQDVFERVGFFTTRGVDKAKVSIKKFLEANIKEIRIV